MPDTVITAVLHQDDEPVAAELRHCGVAAARPRSGAESLPGVSRRPDALSVSLTYGSDEIEEEQGQRSVPCARHLHACAQTIVEQHAAPGDRSARRRGDGGWGAAERFLIGEIVEDADGFFSPPLGVTKRGYCLPQRTISPSRGGPRSRPAIRRPSPSARHIRRNWSGGGAEEVRLLLSISSAG